MMDNASSPFNGSEFDENIRLNNALALAGAGSWQLSLSDDLIWMSDLCMEHLHYQGSSIISRGEMFELVHPDDKANAQKAFDNALMPGSPGRFDIDIRSMKHNNGSDPWLCWKGLVIFDSDGQPSHFSGILKPVNFTRESAIYTNDRGRTGLVVLEEINQQLATVNAEYLAANEELSLANSRLLQSNEHLEQFAFIASHDLQEPLRKILAFADLLKARFSTQLGEGTSYLDKIQASARRMSALIEDILAFSKAALQNSRITRVSLNEVIKHVTADLEVSIEQAGATITVRGLPHVKGDQVQLTQLFQNILSNAIKFRRQGVSPVIDITWDIVRSSDLPSHLHPLAVTAAYDRIDISDNGIGFDPQHQDRIFKLFQRLHGRSEFEGTGIGLAICEKVIGAHGGVIGVKSEVGVGSTFSIYFPIN